MVPRSPAVDSAHAATATPAATAALLCFAAAAAATATLSVATTKSYAPMKPRLGMFRLLDGRTCIAMHRVFRAAAEKVCISSRSLSQKSQPSG